MFWYDKDMERVMQHKKREILKELEETKCRILKELSGVDKVTLTRLREIIADYNRIDFNINEKIKNFIENGNVVINGAEEIATLFKAEIKQLDELSKSVDELSTYVTPEMFGAIGDGVADDTSSVQKAIDTLKPVLLSKTYSITKLNLKENTVLYGLTPKNGLNTENCHIIVSDTIVLHDYNTIENVSFKGNETNDILTLGVMGVRVTIKHCKFNNCNIAIHLNNETEWWRGEGLITENYFENCAWAMKTHNYIDSLCEKNIVTSKCENGFKLESFGMFINNHDYSANGTHITDSIICDGNYFDGNPCKIQCASGAKAVYVNNYFYSKNNDETLCFILNTEVHNAIFKNNIIKKEGAILFKGNESLKYMFNCIIKDNIGYSLLKEDVNLYNNNQFVKECFTFLEKDENTTYSVISLPNYTRIIGKCDTPKSKCALKISLNGVTLARAIKYYDDGTIKQAVPYDNNNLELWSSDEGKKIVNFEIDLHYNY